MASGATHREHDLVFHDTLEAYTCSGCKEIGVKYGYKCLSCKDCTLHEFCAFPDYEKNHPFDSQVKLRFDFYTKIPRCRCDVCDEVIKGYVFKSPESFGFRAHPLCICLPKSHNFSGHPEHKIMRLENENGEFNCNRCNKEKRGWRYQCQDCAEVVDVRCFMKDYYGQVKPCGRRMRNMLLKPVKWAAPIFLGGVLSACLGEVFRSELHG